MTRLLHLDLFTVVLSFLLLTALCVLASGAFWRFRRFLIPADRTIVDLAVCIVSGLALCTSVLSVLFLIVPAGFDLVGLAATLVALGVVFWLPGKTKAPLRAATLRLGVEQAWRAWRRDLVAPLLVAGTLGYFTWVVVTMLWPPIGDITFLHGPVTTYMVNGGYSSVYGHLGYYYPVGFHVFPAALVGPLGLYPAEAVFAYGAFIAALIPPLMYRLARQLGSPTLLALLALSAAFVVHPSDDLEQWILGPFFNGPYPNLLGLLLVLMILIVLADRFPGGLTRSGLRAYLPPVLFYSAVLLWVYPSFAVLVLLHLVLLLGAVAAMGWRSNAVSVRDWTRRHRTVLIGGLVLLGAVLVGLALRLSYLDLVWQLYSTPPPDYVAYRFDYTFLYNNPTGFLILLGVVISAYSLRRKRHVGLASFFLMTAILLFLSLVPGLYALIWPILPSRSVMILGIAAWPLFLAYLIPTLVRLRSWIRQARHRGAPVVPARARSVAIVTATLFVIVLAVQANTDPAVNVLNEPQHYGWYSSTPYFADDAGGISWLAAHAGPQDLVLSDGSFISRYALSVGLVKLSNMPPQEYNQTLFNALDYIWFHPTDTANDTRILKAYNVQYILSTSDWGTYNLSVHQYLAKPFTPYQYIQIFDTYSFLTVDYASGDTRVYGVVQSAL